MARMKDFLSLHHVSREVLLELFDLASDVKRDPAHYRDVLAGKQLALIFEKPSLRTRVTFDVGMNTLGGAAIFLDYSQQLLGERESIHDVAKNLERWVHGIVARTYSHKSVVDLAHFASIPVINGLTDLLHPCQALADYFTLWEKFGKLDGLKIAYVGDGNNTCRALMDGAAKLGVHLTVVAPEGYEPEAVALEQARSVAAGNGAQIVLERDPVVGVQAADVVYTDTWISMGQESEAERRREVFMGYRVREELMAATGKRSLFMHCLPAHRGEEVHKKVIDSESSIVFDQAENRLHTAKALLILLLGSHR